MNTHTQIPTLLSERLREATHATHRMLDQSIMAADPFRNVETYGRFLCVQHGIHRDVEPLYRANVLINLPDLKDRCRLGAVAQDFADLGLDLPCYAERPVTSISLQFGILEALGWLYVVEGSNLGAAFLLKYARKMGLSETHGARHLAEPPEGRAPSWQAFKEALNQMDLSESEETGVVAGAEAAFARVRELVRRHLA